MTATTFLLLAAAVAVALLLVLHLRLGRRQEVLHLAFQSLAEAQKSEGRELRARLDEARALLQDVEEQLAPKVETLEGDLASLEENLTAAVGRLESLGEAADAAKQLGNARARLEELMQNSTARFEAMEATLAGADERARKLEAQLAKVRDVLGERLGALELRVRGGREASRAAPPEAAASQEDEETEPSDAGAWSAPTASVASAPTHARYEEGGFTYEGEEDEEPAAPALRGILILVALLAGLTMLFHFLGVGR